MIPNTAANVEENGWKRKEAMYSNGPVNVPNSSWLKSCGNTSRRLCMCLSTSSILNQLQSLNYCCAQFYCNNPLRLRKTLYQKHAWSLKSLFPIKLRFVTSYLNLIFNTFCEGVLLSLCRNNRVTWPLLTITKWIQIVILHAPTHAVEDGGNQS